MGCNLTGLDKFGNPILYHNEVTIQPLNTQTALMSWNPYDATGTTITVGGSMIVLEDPNNLGFDLKGAAITRPSVQDVYNLSGQDHYMDLGDKADRSTRGELGIELLRINVSTLVMTSPITLSGDHDIEFILGDYGPDTRLLGNLTDQNNNRLLYRDDSLIIEYGQSSASVFTYTAGTFVYGDKIKVSRVGANATLYKNNLPLETLPCSEGDLVVDVVGKNFSNGSNGVVQYLNLNNVNSYLFNQREGLVVPDLIGGNDLTLTSGLVDGSVAEYQVPFDALSEQYANVNQTIVLSGDFKIRIKASDLDFSYYVCGTNIGISSYLRLRSSEVQIRINGVSTSIPIIPSSNPDLICERINGFVTITQGSVTSTPIAVGTENFEIDFLNSYRSAGNWGAGNIEEISFDADNLINPIRFNAENAINTVWSSSEPTINATLVNGAVGQVSFDSGANWITNTGQTPEGLLPQWVKTSNGTTWVADDGLELIGGSTDIFWMRRMQLNAVLDILGDDVFNAQTQADDTIDFIFNGGTLSNGTSGVHNGALFVVFATDGLGVGTISIGTPDDDLVIIARGSVGIAATTATNMYYGNSNPTGEGFNGYLGKYVHYPRYVTDRALALIKIITAPAVPYEGIPDNALTDENGNYLRDDVFNYLTHE